MTPSATGSAPIKRYVTGYGLAMLLTATAFAAVRWHPLSAPHTRALVFTLALVQMVVQFRCFLRRAPWGLVMFAALIILLMAAGTLVVLLNLQSRML